MAISIKPLNDQIWVLPLQNNGIPFVDEFLSVDKSKLLVWTASKGPTKGIVLEVGPGRYDEGLNLIPMPKVNVGEVIWWSAGSIRRFVLDGQKIYSVEGSAVIGIEI